MPSFSLEVLIKWQTIGKRRYVLEKPALLVPLVRFGNHMSVLALWRPLTSLRSSTNSGLSCRLNQYIAIVWILNVMPWRLRYQPGTVENCRTFKGWSLGRGIYVSGGYGNRGPILPLFPSGFQDSRMPPLPPKPATRAIRSWAKSSIILSQSYSFLSSFTSYVTSRRQKNKLICDLLYETPEVCCRIGWLCVLHERKHFSLFHIKSEFYMESSSVWKGILL